MAIFERTTMLVAKGLAAAGASSLILVSAAVTFDVLLRWIFARPLTGLGDLVEVTMMVGIAVAFPQAAVTSSNITIDLAANLVAKLMGSRFRRVVRFFAGLSVSVFFLIATLQMWSYAANARAAHETTSVLRIPRAPGLYMVAVLAGLTAIAGFVGALKRLHEPEAEFLTSEAVLASEPERHP